MKDNTELSLNQYVYNSIDPNSHRHYIGLRQSKLKPNLDPYLGSYADKTFNPIKKLILYKGKNRAVASLVEVMYQRAWNTTNNDRFANQSIFKAGGILEISDKAKKEAHLKGLETKRLKYGGDIYSKEGRALVTKAVIKAHKNRAGTWKHSEETKRKMSKSYYRTPETLAKIGKTVSLHRTCNIIRVFQKESKIIFAKYKYARMYSKTLFNVSQGTVSNMISEVGYTTKSGWTYLGKCNDYLERE